MKERPILFSPKMVKAILEGRKTQTRRILKQQPLDIIPMQDRSEWVALMKRNPERGKIIKCRYGVAGDGLWVRETWRPVKLKSPVYTDAGLEYRADSSIRVLEFEELTEWGKLTLDDKWRPSIFMPRWASRINLEIKNVRVERLQDITEEDAKAEGVAHNWLGPIDECPEEYRNEWRNYLSNDDGFPAQSARESYMTLWQSINPKIPWGDNPWVWVIEFQKL